MQLYVLALEMGARSTELVARARQLGGSVTEAECG